MDTTVVLTEDLGTVGALALDVHGHAGSTGGLTVKAEGRSGDTAVTGAGIYVDQRCDSLVSF